MKWNDLVSASQPRPKVLLLSEDRKRIGEENISKLVLANTLSDGKEQSGEVISYEVELIPDVDMYPMAPNGKW